MRMVFPIPSWFFFRCSRILSCFGHPHKCVAHVHIRIILARLLTIFLYSMFSMRQFIGGLGAATCIENGFCRREQYCIMADEFDLTLSRKLTVHRWQEKKAIAS